jgi:hypothetical protein
MKKFKLSAAKDVRAVAAAALTFSKTRQTGVTRYSPAVKNPDKNALPDCDWQVAVNDPGVLEMLQIYQRKIQATSSSRLMNSITPVLSACLPDSQMTGLCIRTEDPLPDNLLRLRMLVPWNHRKPPYIGISRICLAVAMGLVKI